MNPALHTPPRADLPLTVLGKDLAFEHEESHPQLSKTANALILQKLSRGLLPSEVKFCRIQV